MMVAQLKGTVMHKRVAALLALIVSAVSQGQTATTMKPPDQSAREPFIGVWKALSISDTRPDGTEVPDMYLGAQPTGLLIYDRSGFVCGGNMNADRPKWTDPSKPTRDELATAAEGYDSYCATYEVDAEHQRVTHHVRVDLNPNEVGVDLVRTYAFEGTG